MTTALLLSLSLSLSLSLLGCKDDGGDTGPGDDGGGDSGTAEHGIDWLVVGGGSGADLVLEMGLRSDGTAVALARHSAAGSWWRDTDDAFETLATGAGSSLVAWLDPADGALQDVIVIDSAGLATPEALDVGPDDQVAVLVQATGEVFVDGAAVTAADFTGHVVIQVTSDGSVDWALPVAHEAAAEVGLWGDLTYDSDGTLLVSISTEGTVVADESDPYLQAYGAGELDHTFLRVASDGTPLWLRNQGGASTEYWANMAPLADGYVAAGSATAGMAVGQGEGAVVETTVGGSDTWIARMDEDGVVQWLTVLGTVAEDGVMELVVADDGAVWASGQFAYLGSGPLLVDGVELLQPDAGDGSDAFLVRLDPETGAVTAAAGLTTDTNDVPDLLVPLSDGAVLFGGELSGQVDAPAGAWSDGTTAASSHAYGGFRAVVAADGTLSAHQAYGAHGVITAVVVGDDAVFGGPFHDGATVGTGPDALTPTSAGQVDALLFRTTLQP